MNTLPIARPDHRLRRWLATRWPFADVVVADRFEGDGPASIARHFAGMCVRDGLDRRTAMLWGRSLVGEVSEVPPSFCVPVAAEAIAFARRAPIDVRPICMATLKAVVPEPDTVRTWDDFLRRAASMGSLADRHDVALYKMREAARQESRDVPATFVERMRAAALWRGVTAAVHACRGEPDARPHAAMIMRLVSPGLPQREGLLEPDPRGTLILSAHTAQMHHHRRLVKQARPDVYFLDADMTRDVAQRNAQLPLMLHALRKGGAVFVSPDGAQGHADVHRGVLGMDLTYAASFAWLAEKTGCAVHTVHAAYGIQPGADRGVRLAVNALPRGAARSVYVDAYESFVRDGVLHAPFDFGQAGLKPIARKNTNIAGWSLRRVRRTLGIFER